MTRHSAWAASIAFSRRAAAHAPQQKAAVPNSFLLFFHSYFQRFLRRGCGPRTRTSSVRDFAFGSTFARRARNLSTSPEPRVVYRTSMDSKTPPEHKFFAFSFVFGAALIILSLFTFSGGTAPVPSSFFALGTTRTFRLSYFLNEFGTTRRGWVNFIVSNSRITIDLPWPIGNIYISRGGSADYLGLHFSYYRRWTVGN